MAYQAHRSQILTIVVVNLNGMAYTIPCLESLSRQINRDFKVVVVDQGSTEKGTREYLNSTGYEVIYNEGNIPLNHVWNTVGSACDTEYLCLLNNDTIVPNNFVDDTLEIMRKEPTVGIVIHETNKGMVPTRSNYTVFNNPVYQGWDFTIRKSIMPYIPEALSIFAGDCYIFSRVVGDGYHVAMSHSSPIIHFKERTRITIPNIKKIQTADVRTYKGICNQENLKVIDPSVDRGYSNRYPTDIALQINKKCVYTAITGDYDNMPLVVKPKPGWDYILFTDNDNLTSDNIWRVVHINTPVSYTVLSRVLLARKIKLNPFPALSQYDTILWIDARIDIMGDIDMYASSEHDLKIQKHPFNKIMSDEIKHIAELGLESHATLNTVTSRHADDGYAYTDPMVTSWILLFKNNEAIKYFFSVWWGEMVTTGTHRDQLSCNYSLFKTGLDHEVISYDFSDGVFSRRTRKSPRINTNVKPAVALPVIRGVRHVSIYNRDTSPYADRNAVIFTTLWRSKREIEMVSHLLPPWGTPIYVVSPEDDDLPYYLEHLKDAFDDDRVVMVPNKPYGTKFNVGLDFASEYAIKNSLDWIVVKDSDDIILPGFWNAVAPYLNPSCTVSFKNTYMISMSKRTDAGICELPRDQAWLLGRVIPARADYRCAYGLEKGIGVNLATHGAANGINNIVIKHTDPPIIACKWPDSIQSWNVSTRSPKIYQRIDASWINELIDNKL